MPRYLVERDFGHITEDEFEEATARFAMIGQKHFPEIKWHSTQVCSGDNGTTRAYCIYEAPSAEQLYEHTDHVGSGVIVAILEVVGTLTPESAAV